MDTIDIFTDSLSDLPLTWCELNKVVSVPVYVVFDNEQFYRDKTEITTEGIYQVVLKYGRLPGIAAPSVQDFVQIFTPTIVTGKKVLFISMTSKLSPVYKHAVEAADFFSEDSVVAIDSEVLSAGQAMMVNQAVQDVKRGLSMNKIVSKLEKAKTKLKYEMVFDNLLYVAKGGQVYGLKNKVKSPLKLREIINIQTAKLNLFVQSKENLLGIADKLYFVNNKEFINRELVIISHTMAEEPAEYLNNVLIDQLGVDEVMVTPSICGLLSRSKPRSLNIGYMLQSSK
ncbi:Fatty acid-binding protein [compost metagenome]